MSWPHRARVCNLCAGRCAELFVAGRSTESLAVMWRIVVSLIAASLVAACTLDSPEIVSGERSLYRDGRVTHSWQLSQSQVADVNSWLTKYREGWEPDVNTHAPGLLLYQLRARDGSMWSLNVFADGVVVNGGGHQFAQKFAACDLSLLGPKTMIKCP